MSEYHSVRAVQKPSFGAFPCQARDAVVVPSSACVMVEIESGVSGVALNDGVVDFRSRYVDPSDDIRVHGSKGRARALPKLPGGFGGKTGPSRGCVKPGRGLKVSCALARRLRLGLRLFNLYRNITIRLRSFWYLKPGRRVGAWHAIWRILPKTLRRETA